MDSSPSFDITIIGCGPAGLSAAINAKIRRKNICLFGGEFCTARLYKAPHVDNYLGFPGISGKELREKFLKHLDKMEIRIHSRRVNAILPSDNMLQILVQNEPINSKAVILATGLTTPHYLPGEHDLIGKGVSYCATCDGPLYSNKKVIVVGETVKAEDEVNFLTQICKKVSFLPLYHAPRRLENNVTIINGKPLAVRGSEHFSSLETDRGSYEADGLFIIREVTPVRELLPNLELSDNFIKVNHQMATSISGVYAAGDCTGPPFQVAKSVGEGLIAALNAASYIEE